MHTSELGEHRLNIKQVYALDAMYCTHPAVQAARTVLHSQLLSGGLKLVRDGETLKEVKYGEKGTDGQEQEGHHLALQPAPRGALAAVRQGGRRLLHQVGLCPVVFDVLEEHPAVEAIRRLKNEVGVDGGKRKQREAPAPPKLDPARAHARHVRDRVAVLGQVRLHARVRRVQQRARPGDAPRRGGARLRAPAPRHRLGNCNSPLATVYEMGSFVMALTELAFTAEIARSTPQIVTQLRKPEKGSQLDAGALFFDGESRTMRQ